MGICDHKTTEDILDFFYEHGGRTNPLSIITPSLLRRRYDAIRATSSKESGAASGDGGGLGGGDVGLYVLFEQ